MAYNDIDTDFILSGISEGFRIVDKGATPIPANVDNYKSALARQDQVEKQILTEIQEKRYIITHSKPPLISALGALDKPNGGIRLIHDCSQPKGQGALNEYATLPWTIKYQTVDDAVDIIKTMPAPYLAKVDLKSAYRSVAIHKDNYQFTGLKWRFSGQTDYTYFFDSALCFGSRFAPGIFHRLSMAVMRMMHHRGYQCVCYLDDFLIITESKEEGTRGLTELLTLLRGLGFAIAWDKVVPPTRRLTFLGIDIDTVTMTLAIPQHKVDDLLQTISIFTKKRRASLRQLQQLAGRLAFCSRVVHGGRVYLQRVLDLMRPLQHPAHKARLSEGFHLDLQWWVTLLTQRNFKPMSRILQGIVRIQTDACSSGGGALSSDGSWLYTDWHYDFPQLKHCHINIKEAFTAVLSVCQWAPRLRNSHVIIETDNIFTRAALNRGACRDPLLMACLREMWWLSTVYNFKVKSVHIAGALNILADSLSRLRHGFGHFLFWLSLIGPLAGPPFTMSDIESLCVGHMSINTFYVVLQQVLPRIPWWID